MVFRKKIICAVSFWTVTHFFWQIINLITHINANERKMLVIYDMQDQIGINVIDGYSARLMIDRHKPTSSVHLKWSINSFCRFLGVPNVSTDLTEFFKTEELKHFGPFHLLL